MLNRILHLIKRKLLNQALHPLALRKVNRLFAVQRMATRPAMYGSALHDQRHGIDRHLANSCSPSVKYCIASKEKHVNDLRAKINNFPNGPSPSTNGPIT